VTLAWRLHLGLAGGLADVSKTLKLTVDWSIRESTSSIYRLCRITATFPTLGLRRSGRGTPKDVLDKQNQGHVLAVCAQCADRVEIDDLVPLSYLNAQAEHLLDWFHLTMRITVRANMAKSLRNYDRDYARAEQAAAPLVAEYPRNCIFLLLAGDIEQKLGHTQEAAARFRPAADAPWDESKCEERAHALAREALASLGPK